ncbi:hypothetical protein Tco_1427893 [Tanacetum coccineum]
MSEIRELHAADRRRQAVISEMLKADQRRSAEMRDTTGTGYRTTWTVGTCWRSCTARAARGRPGSIVHRIDHVMASEMIDQRCHLPLWAARDANRNAMTAIHREKGAQTWWNSHVMTVSHDAAYAMTWVDLRKKMTDKYCSRNEMKKLKAEL